MHINSFIMKPDEVNAHTNQYAEGTVSAQSFTERQALEHNRKTVASYQFSRLGTNFQPRGEYAREKSRVHVPKRKHSRQEMNANGGTFATIPERSDAPSTRQQTNARAGGMTFREPPSRGYNPYA